MTTSPPITRSRLLGFVREELEYTSRATPAQLHAALAERTDTGLGMFFRAMEDQTKPLRGVVTEDHVLVGVILDSRSGFTPYIAARIEPHGDNGSRLIGVSGPHPGVLVGLLVWLVLTLGMLGMFMITSLRDTPITATSVLFFGLTFILAFGFAVGGPLWMLKRGKTEADTQLFLVMGEVIDYAEFLRTDALRDPSSAR